MKNFTIPIFVVIITVSCKDSNSLELEKLRSENTILKDSLSKLKKDEWNYKMLIGIPDGKFRVGEKNRIVFYFTILKNYQNTMYIKLKVKKKLK